MWEVGFICDYCMILFWWRAVGRTEVHYEENQDSIAEEEDVMSVERGETVSVRTERHSGWEEEDDEDENGEHVVELNEIGFWCLFVDVIRHFLHCYRDDGGDAMKTMMMSTIWYTYK